MLEATATNNEQAIVLRLKKLSLPYTSHCFTPSKQSNIREQQM